VKIFALLIFFMAHPQSSYAGKNVFDILAGGLKFGTFVVQTTTSGIGYSIDVTAQANGVFGMLTRSKYKGRSRGVAQRNIPSHFEASSSRIFKSRTTRITFVEGVPSLVTVTPEKDQTVLTDPNQIEIARIDPLTLIYRIEYSSGGCPEKQYLYDGRRLTEVSFQVTKPMGDTVLCYGTYEIKKGPDHSLQKGVRQFQVQLIYQKMIGGILYELKDVQVISGNNKIRLIRRQL
jgi:hypothetical protein